MFDVTVTDSGGSIDFDLHVRAMLRWQADLSGVESRVRDIVQESNKEERLKGLGAPEGGGQAPLAHLKASTLARRRGSPIPFVEHGSASRVIANLAVRVASGLNRFEVSVDWLDMPWLRFHVSKEPRTRLPYRNFAYISPWAIPLIDALVVEESDRQFPSMTGGNRRSFSNGYYGTVRAERT